MNWGGYIIIGMATAMSAVVATGIYMVSSDSDTLEDPEYYEKGLAYDQDFNRKEQTIRQQARPDIRVANDTLQIVFSKNGNAGRLLLLRPDNQLEDKTITFSVPGNSYYLPVSALSAGAWQLRLDWEQGQDHFLHEQRIFIKRANPGTNN